MIKTVVLYFTLRLLVIISMIFQFLHGNYQNVFLCILTLFLFMIPYIVNRKFSIELPNTLEVMILLFIFSAEILGEIRNFYGAFSHWDTMLHTVNGFLCAAIGFSLVDILNRSSKVHMKLTPIFVTLVAFCFSMTIGILWEFIEFSGDYFFKMDMQKDKVLKVISSVDLNQNLENIPVVIDDIDETIIYSNHFQTKTIIHNGYLDIGLLDTMKDLFVNFIGALLFSCLGFCYIKNRDSYAFAEVFIPKLKNKRVQRKK